MKFCPSFDGMSVQIDLQLRTLKLAMEEPMLQRRIFNPMWLLVWTLLQQYLVNSLYLTFHDILGPESLEKDAHLEFICPYSQAVGQSNIELQIKWRGVNSVTGGSW